eukprot:4158747-Pyramimonas_sp.AAC.1
MERCEELYGAREPSDGKEASIHAHFCEQIGQVPRLEYAVRWYDVDRFSGHGNARLSMALAP